jgi:organic hydroperoxide reductase OsmC/OhrA
VEPFPHVYSATAAGAQTGEVSVRGPGLPGLMSAPAPQFGGPGTLWSPEALLAAAIADCFILTFRAVSGAALFGWRGLECSVDGILDRVARQTRFTGFTVHATLTIAPGADRAKARRLLSQAERACLIINSLKGDHTLDARVLIAGADEDLTARDPPAAPHR